MNIKTDTFQFQDHMGENKELVEEIRKAACKEGAQTLIVAPCSAGKTYTMLAQVAGSLVERNVVLLVPTVAQALQSLNYGTGSHPVHVATGSQTSIQKYGRTTVATFDKGHELSEWEWVQLASSTLVIDEAHMLVTEKSYRDRAIRGVHEAIREVLEAGGSVIYLTATPRRILFPQFFSMSGGDAANTKVIFCERVDADGRACPKIRPKRLTLLRKAKNTSTFQFLHTFLLNNKQAGKRSLVLYNDKRRIDQMIHQLSEQGVTAFRLTSDDKAFYQEEIIDNEGIPRESKAVYINEAYGSLIEKELLPEADCYCCTSLLEAGSNIKGIWKYTDEITQPKTLVPIFVCRNSRDFDLDKITQFLSRLRFATDEAVVILGMPSYESRETDIRLQLNIFREEAERELERHRIFGTKAEIRDMEGSRGRSLTTDGRILDYIAIVDEAWKRYDGALYAAASGTDDILSEHFGIPVRTVFSDEEKKKEKETKANEDGILDDATHRALSDVLEDKAAMRSLIGTLEIDTRIPSISRLIRFPDGLRLLKETQKLSRLATLPRSLIPKVLEAKSKGTADKEAGALLASAEMEAMRQFADEYSERRLSQIIDFQKQSTGKKVDRYVPLSAISEDAAQQSTIRYLTESERMKQLVALNKHQYFDNKLKRLFLIGGMLDTKELQMLEKELDYIYLNQFAEGSREIKLLMVNCTRALAEYLILRFPEKFLVDEKGIRQRKRPLTGRVRKEDLKQIAEYLPTSVCRLAKGYQRRGTYSVQKVYEHLKALYNLKGMEEKCPDFIEIKGLRKNLHQLMVDDTRTAV